MNTEPFFRTLKKTLVLSAEAYLCVFLVYFTVTAWNGISIINLDTAYSAMMLFVGRSFFPLITLFISLFFILSSKKENLFWKTPAKLSGYFLLLLLVITIAYLGFMSTQQLKGDSQLIFVLLPILEVPVFIFYVILAFFLSNIIKDFSYRGIMRLLGGILSIGLITSIVALLHF